MEVERTHPWNSPASSCIRTHSALDRIRSFLLFTSTIQNSIDTRIESIIPERAGSLGDDPPLLLCLLTLEPRSRFAHGGREDGVNWFIVEVAVGPKHNDGLGHLEDHGGAFGAEAFHQEVKRQVVVIHHAAPA